MAVKKSFNGDHLGFEIFVEDQFPGSINQNILMVKISFSGPPDTFSSLNNHLGWRLENSPNGKGANDKHSYIVKDSYKWVQMENTNEKVTIEKS